MLIRLSSLYEGLRNTDIRRGRALTLPADKAKIIFDHTGLTTDDVHHVQQRVLRDAEFGSPPRNMPRLRYIYRLRFVARYASHVAAPSVLVRRREVYAGARTGAIGQLLTSLGGDVPPVCSIGAG